MPDSAESKFVFVDTEVFDRHKHSLESPNIVRLRELTESGAVELFLTTVTVREIKSHLEREATKAFQQLKSYRRASSVVQRIVPNAEFGPEDEAPFKDAVFGEFDAFLTNCRSTVLDVDQVSAESVFEAYFSQKPPFDAQDKKSEFPDAFAIAALRCWCEANEAMMYVVTGDKDWKRACREDSRLLYVQSLESLLEKFQDSATVAMIQRLLRSQIEEVKRLVTAEAEKLDVTVSLNLCDGEHEDFSVDDIEFDEFHVVEAEDGDATVSVYCTLMVSAHVMADDPDSTYKDPDSGDYNSVWRISGQIEQEIEVEVSIHCGYNPNSPETIEISSVELECGSIELDPEDGELTRDDDDEREDDYFGPDTY